MSVDTYHQAFSSNPKIFLPLSQQMHVDAADVSASVDIHNKSEQLLSYLDDALWSCSQIVVNVASWVKQMPVSHTHLAHFAKVNLISLWQTCLLHSQNTLMESQSHQIVTNDKSGNLFLLSQHVSMRKEERLCEWQLIKWESMIKLQCATRWLKCCVLPYAFDGSLRSTLSCSRRCSLSPNCARCSISPTPPPLPAPASKSA